MFKWLSPSSIYFLKVHKQLIVDEEKDDNPVNELSRKLAAEELSIKVPKMQVSEKDGKMFALNNSTLQLLRHLEKQGKLQNGLIQVEVVPLTKVPANIQMGMTADGNDTHLNYDDSQFSRHKTSKSSSETTKERTTIKQNSEVEDSSAQSLCGPNTSNIYHSSDEDSDEEEEGIDEEASDESSASDETMQCNVCDKTFTKANLLAKHQMKRKHFGCSVCDTVFPSLKQLKSHKETLDHWSDDERQAEEETDEHNPIVIPQREDLERLL